MPTPQRTKHFKERFRRCCTEGKINHMNRTKAREYAFILIFEYRFQPGEIMELFENFVEEYEPGVQEEYIKKVVRSVKENCETIDGIIEKAATGWSIERMSVVSLSALRLAVCEMLYFDDIPPIVSLNEAIAIGKVYGGDECAPFLNGVLSGIMHSLKEKDNV